MNPLMTFVDALRLRPAPDSDLPAAKRRRTSQQKPLPMTDEEKMSLVKSPGMIMCHMYVCCVSSMSRPSSLIS